MAVLSLEETCIRRGLWPKMEREVSLLVQYSIVNGLIRGLLVL